MGRSGDRRVQGYLGPPRSAWFSPGAVDLVSGPCVLGFLGWAWDECSPGLATLFCGLLVCIKLEKKKKHCQACVRLF